DAFVGVMARQDDELVRYSFEQADGVEAVQGGLPFGVERLEISVGSALLESDLFELLGHPAGCLFAFGRAHLPSLQLLRGQESDGRLQAPLDVHGLGLRGQKERERREPADRDHRCSSYLYFLSSSANRTSFRIGS